MKAKEIRAPDNHLPDSFWAFPMTASTTLTTRALQESVLYHEGSIVAHGKMWDIKSKRIAPGVYKVWLKEHIFNIDTAARPAAGAKETT